jgi:serine/threonine-protein kinase
MQNEPTAHALESGSELAGYRIRSVLGEGGMGIVYLAEQPQGGLCALKLLSDTHRSDSSVTARFRREAEYANALDHPHILELYDSGETSDGALFIAMQYVAGVDLAELLRSDGVLSMTQTVSILGQVAGALDCAHASGLIHRDVKPGNIIIDKAGEDLHAYLSDFGLSKNPSQDSVALTQQGQLIGTMAYAAPEEILAHPRDHRVDVYSLACVLYEALVGTPPFQRDTDLDVLYAHVGDPRPSLTDRRGDLPSGIDDIVAKGMAISPDDRHETCGEFIAAIAALVPAEPSAAEGVTVANPGLRLVVRNGPAVGKELIVEDELELGRLMTLDGAGLDDTEISRCHGRVRRFGAGYVVEDLHSSNGTFVNGQRIASPSPLAPGDELRIGSTTFLASAIDDLATSTQPSRKGRRLILRLEVDLETGDLGVAIEDGASARIVRDGDAWRVEPL